MNAAGTTGQAKRARSIPRRPALQLFIDADECIDCGACLPECPASAIDHERDAHPADLLRNAAFFARGSEP